MSIMFPTHILFLAVVIIASLYGEMGADGSTDACPDSEKYFEDDQWPPINYKVAIFYYKWYRNMSFDSNPKSQWSHARGSLLVDGKRVFYNVSEDDISSTFFPVLGAYSSRDIKTVDQHFRWIRSTGIGVVAISWVPPMYAPGDGYRGQNLTMYFDVAKKYGLKIAFLVEKYDPSKKKAYKHVTYGGDSILEFCKHVIETYGNHSALHRIHGLPLYYMYGSNKIEAAQWESGLKAGGPEKTTVRGTKYDGFFAGIFENKGQILQASRVGFDAVFMYIGQAFEDFKTTAERKHLVYIPSVDPGYDDRRIRSPGYHWGRTPSTNNYEEGLKIMLDWKIEYLTITSFNEWHESTQIEPAAQKKKIVNTAWNPTSKHRNVPYKYKNYPNQCPYYYLDLTRQFVAKHRKMLINEGLITGVQETSSKASDSSD